VGNLAAVGQLDLLRQLYGRILIPQAVHAEIAIVGKGQAEAIALAVELQADLLLLDERKGRVVASRLGLKSVGLLGALIEAKHRSLILAIKPIVDDLIATAGFWITQKLYEQVLHAAGE
jgi:predicted nucleic acid-binding protein